MTLRLFAVLIALALVAWLPRIRNLRDGRWFHSWVMQCNGSPGAGRVVLVLLPPVAAVAVIAILLNLTPLLGVLWLVFAVIVLLYTLGPRNLEGDIDEVLLATDPLQRDAAAQNLKVHAADPPLPFTAAVLVEAGVYSALQRRFGVLFWFLLLGPAGAFGYRLAQWLAQEPAPDAQSLVPARHFADLLNWLPAHLMVFAMALVSNFDAVIKTWRAWHSAPARPPWAFDIGFLGAVARAGVDADVVAGDGYSEDISDPLQELADTRRLLLRVLAVWLGVMALLVLARWIA